MACTIPFAIVIQGTGGTAVFGLESEGYIQMKLQGQSKKGRTDSPALEFRHDIKDIKEIVKTKP